MFEELSSALYNLLGRQNVFNYQSCGVFLKVKSATLFTVKLLLKILYVYFATHTIGNALKMKVYKLQTQDFALQLIFFVDLSNIKGSF